MIVCFLGQCPHERSFIEALPMVEGDKNGISQRALDVVLVATWKSRHGSSVSPAVLPVSSFASSVKKLHIVLQRHLESESGNRAECLDTGCLTFTLLTQTSF